MMKKQDTDLLVILADQERSAKPDESNYIYVTEFTDEALIHFYKDFTISHAGSNNIIPVMISSYGGSYHNLMAMLDIIKHSKKPVATVAMGKAMSAASLLLSSGTKGLRFAATNTDIMIHQVSSGEFGRVSDLTNDIKHTEKINENFLSILSKNCGKPVDFFKKEIKKAGNSDIYLTASQAKKIGLVDYVDMPLFIKI
jgi:ATP-dependent Clp protease, protease subunit